MARTAKTKTIDSIWGNQVSIFDHILGGKATPVFSQDTNVHPSFGVTPKIHRNKIETHSVYVQTQGYMLIGDRLSETMSDPLHRPPRYVLQRAREEGSIAGRSRGMIRSAAPGQVTWKNPYWRTQRPPYIPVQGPFTHGQLQDQSILQRINGFLGGSASRG